MEPKCGSQKVSPLRSIREDPGWGLRLETCFHAINSALKLATTITFISFAIIYPFDAMANTTEEALYRN